jgi:hypothetical protein
MLLIKFFTLKVVTSQGYTRRASLRERIEWVKKGCPLRNKKVVDRYFKFLHSPFRTKKSNTAIG